MRHDEGNGLVGDRCHASITAMCTRITTTTKLGMEVTSILAKPTIMVTGTATEDICSATCSSRVSIDSQVFQASAHYLPKLCGSA